MGWLFSGVSARVHQLGFDEVRAKRYLPPCYSTERIRSWGRNIDALKLAFGREFAPQSLRVG